MALYRKLFRRKRPPFGLSEVCDRVYVFDSCSARDVPEGEEHGLYLTGIMGQLQHNFPEGSFMVFNFREVESRSQIAGLLHDYNVTVVEYPCQYFGCPLLPMEMIHHFLISCENWLSHNQQNAVLMNCEQCGWPVLAFMMAALLIFRTQSYGEWKILDTIYKRAHCELLRQASLLNPFPSQFRYLQYVARKHFGQAWPPVEKALTLDRIILKFIPKMDENGGFCPLVQIHGLDPQMVGHGTPKVLFSTSNRSKILQYYKQVDCALLRIDISCHIQGDAVLECVSYENDVQQEAMMFRVMFNTAFIRSNILVLSRKEIDILWDAKDQFPEDFRAEVVFSEMVTANSHKLPNVQTIEETDGLARETSMKDKECFRPLKSFGKAVVFPDSEVEEVKAESIFKASKDKCMKASLISMWKQPKPSIQQSLDANTDANTIRKKIEYGEPQADPLASSQFLHAFTVAENKQKHAVALMESSKYAPSLKPSSDKTSNRKNIEPAQVHVALQLPAQSKLMSHSQLNTSISLPVSNCSSLQGSPGPISRYHSAASVLGITALLYDHAASNNDAINTMPIASTSSSSALTSLPRPLHVDHAKTPSLSASPLPPPPISGSSKQVIGESCLEETESTTPGPLPLQHSSQPSSEVSVTKKDSEVPPLPPPPPPPAPASARCHPQRTLKDRTMKGSQKTLLGEGNLSSATPYLHSPSNLRTTLGVENLNSTTPSYALYPPSTASYVCPSPSEKASQASFTYPPPPPPPPPPPSSMFQVSPYSTSKNSSIASSHGLYSTSNSGSSSLHPQKLTPPPPPPNPSPRTASSAPPPPPLLRSSEKGSLPDNLTFEPPMQSAPAPTKTGDVISKKDSWISNCSVPSVPGVSNATFNSKAQGTSRSCSKHQAQTKKANLKPYHWLKLTRAMQGSLWAEAQHPDEASKAPDFDISELETLFSATLPNSDNGISASKSNCRLSNPRSEKVQLIELRRAYNCEIMLSKVKIPLPELTSSVLVLDDSALEIDQVENLIKYCPSKAEMELLKGYNGSEDNLGKCEQFFLELMKVPRIESKLRVFLFKLQFHTQVCELKRNLNVINSAVQEVRSSVKLKRIMHTILILGNALNHGTARGSAIGFRVDSLLKLTDTRARNSKTTLMHYLCKVLAEKLPELLDFPKDLVSLEAATKIQLKFLAEEMQAISKGIEKAVQELTASETDGHVSDVFRKTLKEFLCAAEREVRSLASLYSTAGRNADLLALYFGEDPTRCPFEQVVSTLHYFVKMFVQAHKENCKQLEFERKKEKKDAVNEMEKVKFPRKESEFTLQDFIRSKNTIC